MNKRKKRKVDSSGSDHGEVTSKKEIVREIIVQQAAPVFDMTMFVDQKTHQRQIHTMWEQVKDLKAKLEEYHEQSMSEADAKRLSYLEERLEAKEQVTTLINHPPNSTSGCF